MRRFILGTDWWSDCDDAVALRVLTQAVRAQKIKLCGIGINACMEYSAPSVDGFLSREGLSGIPIGIDLAATGFEGKAVYQKNLAPFAKAYASNADAEDATALYRRILAAADEPVEILEIGFLQVISGLLQSKGDEISPLSGLELMRQKVKKVWVMGGKWDEAGGKEHNFINTEKARHAAHVFCKLCPVPVTFLGFEVGLNVITGTKLKEDDVLRSVMLDHGSVNGRHSWDPMLALLALTGDEEKAGYTAVCGTASVNPETGENHFAENQNGLHKYVIKKQPNAYYADLIDNILQ